ncbi:neuronal acetylcholine receptor subunit alpha-6-like [Gigantopelta aegis]|uniref:neuronal acetylcholine receptor subunit alpha-6-like n=1 Tax=Gigantopelta aegis TaxID=1735272 RepID=UPI001B88E4E2|nr:neuronal acetylcholine receptor subunit alpha-6-like [Gigantopelta aegis]
MVPMKQTYLFINVLLFYLLSVYSTELPPLYKLHKHLCSTYQRDIRPVKNYNTTVMVHIVFMLSSLEGLDGAKQTFRAAGWLTISWTDEMLTWDRCQYPGLHRIDFPAEKVWKPDLSIRNDAKNFAMLSQYGGHCIATPDGKVTWYLALRKEMSCAVNVEKFPFDSQTCSINLIQWATDITEVNFTVSSEGVAPLLFSHMHEWQVTGHSVDRSTVPYSGMEQVYVTFKYDIKRKPLTFIISTVFPLMLLSLLNLVVFLLPAESGEKMNLSVSVVLAYAVLMTIVSSVLPATSDTVSIFGVYTLIMFFIKVMTIIFSVIVLRLYYTDPRVPLSPRWKPLLAAFRLMPKHSKPLLEQPEHVPDHPTTFPEQHEMVQSNNMHGQNERDPEHPECCVWKHLSVKMDRAFFCVTAVATLGGTTASFVMLLI